MENQDIDKSIPLRYRFQEEINMSYDAIFENVKKQKELQKPKFWLKVIDNHVFVSINNEEKKFFSPHLHLDFEKKDDNSTTLRGLYGPEPTLWTFFMFLHFFIASGFILLSMLAYSNYILQKPFAVEIFVMILLVFSWVGLYFFAKNLRKLGIPQTHELEKIKKLILNQD